jgi:hypothetical protein
VTAHFPRGHPEHIAAIGNLALSRHEAGEHEEALVLFRESYQLALEQLGPNARGTLSRLLNYALATRFAGDHEKAIQLLRDGARRRAILNGDDHEMTWYGRQQLAIALLDRDGPGDVQEACDILLDIRRRWNNDPPYDPVRLSSDLVLIDALRDMKCRPEADALLAEKHDQAEAILDDARPSVAWIEVWYRHLAGTDPEAAAAWRTRIGPAVADAYGPDSPQMERISRLSTPVGGG